MTQRQRNADPDDRHPDELIVWARRVFIGALTCAGIIILYYIYKFKGESFTANVGSWGQVGDFIGGTLNPLIGGATIFLLFISLQVQRRELRDTSEALEKANQYAAQQAFEQSLFSWLANCRELLNAMEANVPVQEDGRGNKVCNAFKGKALIRAWYDYRLTPGFEKNYLISHRSTSQNKRETLLEEKVLAYKEIFRDNRSELDAYLRTMFRLFEWIDGEQHTLTKNQRWHYASLVRAQISWSELVIHFYNGFTDEGAAFVEYYERYALFDNIRTGKDRLIDCVAEGNIIKYGKISVPYSKKAFSSDLARENFGIQKVEKSE